MGGLAKMMSGAGVPTETTMRQGRWKTAAMVSWHVGKEAAGGALQWRGRGVESDA